ncbi:MAG: hypothetical protein GX875_00770, partial [Propionibacterium sp.]|nr:hypothetical protein [Propionibacterium sp.]
MVSIFGWDRLSASTGAGVWFNYGRRVRLAGVVEASSNWLGFTVIDDGPLVRWAINVDGVLDLAGHECCGSRRLDRFSS